MTDRFGRTSIIKWTDGLGENRNALQYYLHMYPMGHVGATITATNRVLDLGGFPHLTKQEFFQLQGIMFALSFYPKFSVRDLI